MRHDRPPPEHRGPAQRWVNEEVERPLKEGCERLQKIVNLILEKGYVTIDKNYIEPADPCECIIRYERMPAGELSLKLELKWNDDLTSRESEEVKGDAPIE